MTEQKRLLMQISGPDIQQDTIECIVSATDIFTIGRLDDNDLTLKQNKISRNHAQIRLEGNDVVIVDLDSGNGTHIGTQRLEPNTPHKLKASDSIILGPFSLVITKIEDVKKAKKPKTAAPPKETPKTPKQEQKPKTQRKQTQKPSDQTLTDADSPKTERSAVPIQPPPPPTPVSSNGHGDLKPLRGVPVDVSNWLEYLPALYHDNKFIARLLLIFEAGFVPYEWIIDHFDLYLDPKMAPSEFLQWFGTWVDILVPANIPEERQHAIAQELGTLFKARGTRHSLSRHLELIFGKAPEITEPPNEFATFVVRLSIGKDQDTPINREIAESIIEAQRPIHTRYRLVID